MTLDVWLVCFIPCFMMVSAWTFTYSFDSLCKTSMVGRLANYCFKLLRHFIISQLRVACCNWINVWYCHYICLLVSLTSWNYLATGHGIFCVGVLLCTFSEFRLLSCWRISGNLGIKILFICHIFITKVQLCIWSH